MSRAVISIGSNLGDRMGHLQGAIDHLGREGIRVVDVSGVYETEPVGGPEQDHFLNAVAILDTSLDPQDLLVACQEVEMQHHRVRDVRWGPRTLDVDIIHIDGVTLNSETLTIPHPRAQERAFVCVPLLEVDPDARIGVQRVSELPISIDGVERRVDLTLHLPEVPA